MICIVLAEELAQGEIMKNFTKALKNIIKDESGQGTTEYVLLLVVLVALAMIFKNQIKDMVASKIDEIKGGMGTFTVGQ